jgi:DnaJ domain
VSRASTAWRDPERAAETARREPALGRQPIANLYDVLQVSSTAEPEVIRAAYRVLARTHHPDLSADPRAAGRMRQLNRAYEILNDPRRRAHYDLHCVRSRRVAAASPAPRSTASHASREVRPRRRELLSCASGRASPILIRALALVVLLTLVAVLGMATWLVFEGIDDRPTGTYHPRGGLPPSASALSMMPASLSTTQPVLNYG